MNEELQIQSAGISSKMMNHFLQTGDVLHFKEEDKLKIMHMICNKLGVDPITRPVELLKLPATNKTPEREIWYLSSTGCEMIAAKWKMSFKIKDRGVDKEEGIAYCVMEATIPETNRVDEATAFVECAIKDMKGEIKLFFGTQMANARMKCETKARRRLIKRLAGLDYIDEDDVKDLEKERKSEALKSLMETTDIIKTEIKDEIYDKTRPEHKRLLAEWCKRQGLDPKIESDKEKIIAIQEEILKHEGYLCEDYENKLFLQCYEHIIGLFQPSTIEDEKNESTN